MNQLLEAGHDVVALVRSPETADLPPAVAIAEGDLTDRESMREPMVGVDGVFHLPAWYRVGGGDPETARRVNVDGTRNVLELMSELDVPKGIYTSSLAIFSDTSSRRPDESYRYDGPHLTTYDRTKWRAHYEVAHPLMKRGLPLVVVMPGVIYGPGDAGPTGLLWDAYFDGRLAAIPRETGFCWGRVADVARAHRIAMDRGDPGEDYIVAGEPLTLVEAFDVVADATGRAPPRAVAPWVFGGLARISALVERAVDLPPMYAAESLRLLAGTTYYGDNEKAKRELDLEHRPVEAGLAGLFEGRTR